MNDHDEVGALVIRAADWDLDLNALLDGWKKLSEDKGWPKNPEGLRRYLARIGQNGPKRKMPTEPPHVREVVPDGFVEWFKTHKESSFMPEGTRLENGTVLETEDWGLKPDLAWKCARYQREWHAAQSAPSGHE